MAATIITISTTMVITCYGDNLLRPLSLTDYQRPIRQNNEPFWTLMIRLYQGKLLITTVPVGVAGRSKNELGQV